MAYRYSCYAEARTCMDIWLLSPVGEIPECYINARWSWV